MSDEPSAIAVVTPEERARAEREGHGLVVEANGLKIADTASLEVAAKWLQLTLLPMKNRLKDLFRPRIQQAHELHRGLLNDEKRFLQPIESAERIVREKLRAYEEEQARLRRQAEEERRREQARLEAAERERVRVENERLRREAEERRLAEAVAAEQAGDLDTAEKLVSAPVAAPTVVERPVFVPPAPSPPKVSGLSYREEWTFEITDESQIPREYLVVDEAKIRAHVRSMREKSNIPGVHAFKRSVPTVRA